MNPQIKVQLNLAKLVESMTKLLHSAVSLSHTHTQRHILQKVHKPISVPDGWSYLKDLLHFITRLMVFVITAPNRNKLYEGNNFYLFFFIAVTLDLRTVFNE